jgi:hypothetical protein
MEKNLKRTNMELEKVTNSIYSNMELERSRKIISKVRRKRLHFYE